jgi:hypothetical protein
VELRQHQLLDRAADQLVGGVAEQDLGGVFFRSLSDEQQVFLAFLFAGMASVGIPVYAAA